jgi:hypothetical protein
MLQGTHEWLLAIRFHEAFFNAILLLTHPSQYYVSVCARNITLSNRTLIDREPRIQDWISLYTGISVMINRITPKHWDKNGPPSSFDLLASIGNPSDATIALSELELEFKYGGGTVFELTGRLLAHEVGDWGEGDRICYAHWLREQVLKLYSLPLPPYATSAAALDMQAELSC